MFYLPHTDLNPFKNKRIQISVYIYRKLKNKNDYLKNRDRCILSYRINLHHSIAQNFIYILVILFMKRNR